MRTLIDARLKRLAVCKLVVSIICVILHGRRRIGMDSSDSVDRWTSDDSSKASNIDTQEK